LKIVIVIYQSINRAQMNEITYLSCQTGSRSREIDFVDDRRNIRWKFRIRISSCQKYSTN